MFAGLINYHLLDAFPSLSYFLTIHLPSKLLMLLLLSRFSHVRLCATPQMAAYQAPQSLGFSRQEHWSGMPFPSPTHESEKWKWSHSVVSDPQRPHGLQPSRLLHPWDFPGKSTGVRWHCLLHLDTNPITESTFERTRLMCLRFLIFLFYKNFINTQN